MSSHLGEINIVMASSIFSLFCSISVTFFSISDHMVQVIQFIYLFLDMANCKRERNINQVIIKSNLRLDKIHSFLCLISTNYSQLHIQVLIAWIIVFCYISHICALEFHHSLCRHHIIACMLGLCTCIQKILKRNKISDIFTVSKT